MTGLVQSGLVDKVSWDMQSTGQELIDRDVIVAQRTANESANPILMKLTEAGYNWTYDLDDMLWGVEHTNAHAFAFYAQQWVQETIQKTMEAATQITVSTPELAEEVELKVPGKPVTILPNTVSELPGLARDPLDEPFDPDGRRRRPLKVLWAGSRTHDQDLEIIKYGTKRLAERGEIELYLMGVEYRDILPWAKGVYPWIPNNEYLQAVSSQNMDVMLCPVKPGRFNACKSHLKALDAMAAGMIPIASNYPTYNRLVTHGENGMLARWQEDDWYKKLRAVANMDWYELQAMRAAGMRSAAQYLNTEWSGLVHETWGRVKVNG